MNECGARDIGDECWEWDGDTAEFVGRVYQHALSNVDSEPPQVAAPEIVAIALESARTSLAAYGNHPIIEGRINKALQALAQAGVVTDLVAALHYLLEQTVDQDLAHGLELTEGEMDARQQAIRAIERAGGVS
ncbi:MAG: hypothetical protein Q7Q73_09250 [Verrucomicrobiota bacterium JB024]|nr:hypothetical protein [Verrucomicrobiota bacterium JB024]